MNEQAQLSQVESSRVDPSQVELSIIMPCLNEAETLQTCIQKAQRFLSDNCVAGEVVIADNGSTDGSQDIARSNGARVVNIREKGYGAALMGGIASARGRFVVMGDSDDSYDFTALHLYLEKLRQGYDLVMGNRFRGGIKKGAMPFLHRYLGNPVLSWLGRLFFNITIGDFHCGLRGFSRKSILQLNLHTTGMEFASEMVVKASLLGLRITEVPTTLSPDGRSRPPHLRTWRDGWRHLRFLLMYSPRWLFLYPGLFLMLVGVVFSALLVIKPVTIDGVRFDVHTLLYTTAAVIIGFQCVTFYVFTKVFAMREKLLPEDSFINGLFDLFYLERGILAGLVMIAGGLVLSVSAFSQWSHTGFGGLNPSDTLRLVIPGVTLGVLGVQILLYSFFFSILGLKRKV
jgi:glycosyltransferase involved in cell wall biosynthesis